jgi:hypothetical protein
LGAFTRPIVPKLGVSGQSSARNHRGAGARAHKGAGPPHGTDGRPSAAVAAGSGSPYSRRASVRPQAKSPVLAVLPLSVGVLPWVAVVSCLAACGGAGSHGTHVVDDATTFEVGPLGAGWKPVDLGDENDAAWASEGGAIIQANASCSPDLDIPLEALTQHLLIGFTERNTLETTRVPLDGREALRSHITAKLDGVARELLLVVVKKNDCVYDFALISPPGESFVRAEPEFTALVSALRTEGRRR